MHVYIHTCIYTHAGDCCVAMSPSAGRRRLRVWGAGLASGGEKRAGSGDVFAGVGGVCAAARADLQQA